MRKNNTSLRNLHLKIIGFECVANHGTTYRNNLMLVLVDLGVKLAFFLLVSPADFMVEMLEKLLMAE